MPALFKLNRDAASGVILMPASALAVILANSPLASYYDLLLQVRDSVQVAGYGIEKPLLRPCCAASVSR